MNGILFAISIAAFLWILISNEVVGNEVHAVSEQIGTSEVPWGPPPGLPPPPGYGPPPPLGNGLGPPLPPPGEKCPSLTQDSRWAQWVPGAYPQTSYFQFYPTHNLPTSPFSATLFEFVLFGMAVYKTIVSSSAKVNINGRRSLTAILLSENIIYFLA